MRPVAIASAPRAAKELIKPGRRIEFGPIRCYSSPAPPCLCDQFQMLTVPQIEALRKTNPQLYETLKRLAGASLGPNQGWSLDDQITDGTEYARVVTGAHTGGRIYATNPGI